MDWGRGRWPQSLLLTLHRWQLLPWRKKAYSPASWHSVCSSLSLESSLASWWCKDGQNSDGRTDGVLEDANDIGDGEFFCFFFCLFFLNVRQYHCGNLFKAKGDLKKNPECFCHNSSVTVFHHLYSGLHRPSSFPKWSSNNFAPLSASGVWKQLHAGWMSAIFHWLFINAYILNHFPSLHCKTDLTLLSSELLLIFFIERSMKASNSCLHIIW